MLPYKQSTKNILSIKSLKVDSKLLEIRFLDNKLSINIYNEQKSNFSFNFSELKLLLYFLNNKCSSNIYEYNYNVESINSYINVLEKIIENLSLSNNLTQTAELINESCVETIFTILEYFDYSL